MSFIDDCTRVSWVYLLKSKHDFLHVILQFSKMVITQFNTQVKVFHSDNGCEFVNRSLATLFQENGILHQTTCADTPQHNGIMKHKNHYILEVARALCFTMHVPKRFWANAIMIVVFLIYRMFAVLLIIKHLCICYVHVHSHLRNKLDSRALKCVILGYSNSQKGHKCFHPPSGKYFVSMDVQFNER